jgi:hypothetical protein
MSLTSYRAAPPRVTKAELEIRHASCGLDQCSKTKSRRSGYPAAALKTLRMGLALRRQQSLATTYSSTA